MKRISAKEDPYSHRHLLAIVKLDVGEGQMEQIHVHHGDDVIQLVQDFCRLHDLEDKCIAHMVRYITHQINLAQQKDMLSSKQQQATNCSEKEEISSQSTNTSSRKQGGMLSSSSTRQKQISYNNEDSRSPSVRDESKLKENYEKWHKFIGMKKAIVPPSPQNTNSRSQTSRKTMNEKSMSSTNVLERKSSILHVLENQDDDDEYLDEQQILERIRQEDLLPKTISRTFIAPTTYNPLSYQFRSSSNLLKGRELDSLKNHTQYSSNEPNNSFLSPRRQSSYLNNKSVVPLSSYQDLYDSSRVISPNKYNSVTHGYTRSNRENQQSYQPDSYLNVSSISAQNNPRVPGLDLKTLQQVAMNGKVGKYQQQIMSSRNSIHQANASPNAIGNLSERSHRNEVVPPNQRNAMTRASKAVSPARSLTPKGGSGYANQLRKHSNQNNMSINRTQEISDYSINNEGIQQTKVNVLKVDLDQMKKQRAQRAQTSMFAAEPTSTHHQKEQRAADPYPKRDSIPKEYVGLTPTRCQITRQQNIPPGKISANPEMTDFDFTRTYLSPKKVTEETKISMSPKLQKVYSPLIPRINQVPSKQTPISTATSPLITDESHLVTRLLKKKDEFVPLATVQPVMKPSATPYSQPPLFAVDFEQFLNETVFATMDTDSDGFISVIDVNIESLSTEILTVIQDFLFEMADNSHMKYSFSQFKQYLSQNQQKLTDLQQIFSKQKQVIPREELLPTPKSSSYQGYQTQDSAQFATKSQELSTSQNPNDSTPRQRTISPLFPQKHSIKPHSNDLGNFSFSEEPQPHSQDKSSSRHSSPRFQLFQQKSQLTTHSLSSQDHSFAQDSPQFSGMASPRNAQLPIISSRYKQLISKQFKPSPQ